MSGYTLVWQGLSLNECVRRAEGLSETPEEFIRKSVPVNLQADYLRRLANKQRDAA